MKPTRCLKQAAAVLIAVLLLSCNRNIALFNEMTFQRTSVLKARVLILMDHGTEPYGVYRDKADSLMVEAQIIYAMEKARVKNNDTEEQWNQLIGSKTGLLTGFFITWKKNEKNGETYLENKKDQVAAGFDKILKLEAAKIKH